MTTQKQSTTMSDLKRSTINAEIHEMFGRYGETFVDLAVGRRTDMGALLDFYGAPLRFIGSDFHMIMMDSDAITGENGIGGEMLRLQKEHFGASTLDECDVQVLNAQAALVEALWLRRDENGNLLSLFAVTYVVVLTQDGWRITSAVDKS